MGAINVKHTGSGADIALSSDGTNLLLDGTAIGGGGGDPDLYRDNASSATTPSATGTNAVAIGNNSVSSGTDSMAIGASTVAASTRAVVLGGSSQAYGINSVTLGFAATVQSGGTDSSALGTRSQIGSNATGATAIAKSYASGSNSFAAAIANNGSSYGATGTGSISIGLLSKANQIAGTAVGYGATSTHQASSAFGTSATTTANNQIALGGSGITARISGAYTLPTADGTANQVLTTDGSGAVTFATAGGGGGSLTTAAISGASQTVDFTKDIVTSTVTSKTTTYAFSGASAVDQTTLIIDNNYSEPATTGDVRKVGVGNPWVGSATPIYNQAPLQMTITNDGTKLYSAYRPDGSTNYVRCWTLSTAFDLSTTSTTFTTYNFTSSDINMNWYGMQISPDGLKLSLIADDLAGTGEYLKTLTMTTANDLSTASISSRTLSSSSHINIRGLAISQNGSHLYTMDGYWNNVSGRTIVYYTLSGWGGVPTYDSILDIADDVPSSHNLMDIQISADGTRLIVLTSRSLVITYLLSTAYDLSTATKYEAAALVEPSASEYIFSNPNAMVYRSNALAMPSAGDRIYHQYASGSSDIVEYRINGSITLAFPSSTEVPVPFNASNTAIPLTINPSKGTKTALQLTTVDTGSTYQVTGVAESIE
jgi:hypothetical protein